MFIEKYINDCRGMIYCFRLSHFQISEKTTACRLKYQADFEAAL